MFITSLRTSDGSTIAAHALFLLGCWLSAYAILATDRHITAGTLGFFFLIVGSKAVASRKEFAVDSKKQRYRHCILFFGLPIGQWQPLPPITKVVLKSYSEYQAPTKGRGSMGVWQTTWALKSCVILLSVADSKQGIVVGKVHVKREAEARQLARDLAIYLHVKLWSA